MLNSLSLAARAHGHTHHMVPNLGDARCGGTVR